MPSSSLERWVWCIPFNQSPWENRGCRAQDWKTQHRSGSSGIKIWWIFQCSSPKTLAAFTDSFPEQLPGPALEPASLSLIALVHPLKEAVRNVVLQSKKSITRLTYKAKWKRFSILVIREKVGAEVQISVILDCFRASKQSGFSIPSIRVF